MFNRSFFIILFFILCRVPGWGQESVWQQKVDFSFQDIRVEQLIDTLSALYEINFAYDAGILSLDSVVTTSGSGMLLSQWIHNFFGITGAEVSLLDQQIVIGKPRGKFNLNTSMRIVGTVKQYATGEPLGMVNIGVVDYPIGTVTNDRGDFEIILPNSYAGEILSFSHLGFLSKRMQIPASDTLLTVLLPESAVNLPEVEVKYMNPVHIIEQMIRNIGMNYPSDPYFLTAFFRETIRQDGKYVDISEAVIEVYKPSYQNTFDMERARFIKGRKGKEVSEMDLVNFKLEGGPYHFSRLDVVRQGDFFPGDDKSFIYVYSLEGMGIEQDKMVYRVKFRPREDNDDLLYQGELRIDSESFALVSAVFELTPSSIRRSRNYLIKRDARRFKTRPYFARYVVDYRPWGSLWVLNRVRGEVSMRITDKSSGARSDIQTVSEMVVSDLTRAEGHPRVRGNEMFKADYVLSETITDFDPDFWKDYNIIRPDEALEKVFSADHNKQ